MARDAHHAAAETSPHAQLATLWSAALDAESAHNPVPPALVTALARKICAATADGTDIELITVAGARLAHADACGREVLGRSVAVLHNHFTAAGPPHTSASTSRLLAAFADGYERALRIRLQSEQELRGPADIAAFRLAEQRLRGCESRVRALRHNAGRDGPTGLPNRSRFFDAVATATALRYTPIGLCYVDLDLFRRVNDSAGFAAGDELLGQVATRIRDCVPEPDRVVARVSGNAFAVLVPRCGGACEMATLARSILDALEHPFEVGGRRMHITASAGVTAGSGHNTGNELIRAAERAMRWAKASGHNALRVFDTGRDRAERARAGLLADLPGALARNQFFLDYQPIVALADSSIVAIEALVRWQHPEHGILAPAQFIGLAEDYGHITELGAAVLARACQDIRGWHRRGRTPTVSVNVSAAEVADANWLERVYDTIADSGIEPSWLQLELTERGVIRTNGLPRESLQRLAATGVRIAIDDFGTGYSSLAYLGQLPVHTVKLAEPFVQRIRKPDTSEQSDLAVLQAVIDLTHALNSTVTAECVETRYQADQLRTLGCDSAQGWYFHRPVPADDIPALLNLAS
ncbi:putative bifunctional diguanylate cyclase/phosphodiesterase [Nocardia brasiliensis]|uniref:putative bifunctional diguanylate cyclase/phosphodiesterase n=1 Tax=Nocardia brasiliensis TaxID=37326 RepID=UPI002457AF91|nr:bifunctional diguanylate cyclase/phosphodiesterase [Nocardia brasiliensis]